MTLRLPAGWEADRIGDDWLQVALKGCNPAKAACANFAVIGPKVLKGGEYLEKYRTNRPFAPGTGVSPCRFTPSSNKYGERFVSSKPLQNGHRQVGQGHRAQYRVWAGECYNVNTGRRTKSFKQREWYLAESRILIVDGWNIPALAGIVSRATWK
uniref:hypothetical protein n=1 Tax=Nonomuraea bangladeshensis TaxID=404385 RepID=UPI003F4981FF